MAGNLTGEVTKVDAAGMSYRQLNARLRELVAGGASRIELVNVCGQRYIGTDLEAPVEIELWGTPGNDLGAFMDGPRITVRGNAQDGCGNTMNEGEIVVHGHAGDIIGLSARGGKIFVRDGVGYRAGIHMKGYGGKEPALVIGDSAQDFVGEYMAGGIMVLLGLNLADGQHKASFIGTGMHGGVIYLRGSVSDFQLGKEVGRAQLTAADLRVITGLVEQFSGLFDLDAKKIMDQQFVKLFPRWLRPYGRLYAY